MNHVALTAVLFCLGIASTARAQDTYFPSQDTYVKSDTPDTSYGSAIYLSAEEYPATALTERLYVKFALPDLVGQTVSSATLRLMCVRENGGGGAGDNLELWEVTSPWTDALTWTESQALMVGTLIAIVPTPNYSDLTNTVDPPQPIDFDVTSLVQGWAAGVANNGLMVRMAPGSKADMRFGSIEEGLASKWPVLTVTYASSSPPPPSPPGPGSSGGSGRDNANGDELCLSAVANRTPAAPLAVAALALLWFAIPRRRS